MKEWKLGNLKLENLIKKFKNLKIPKFLRPKFKLTVKNLVLLLLFSFTYKMHTKKYIILLTLAISAETDERELVIHTSVLRKLTVPRNGPLGKRDLIVVSCEIRKRWSTYWRGVNEWDSTHVKPLPVSSKQRIFIYFSKTPCLKQHLTYEKGRLRWLCIFLHIYLSKFKTYPPPRSLTNVGCNLQTTCTSRSKPGSRHSFQFLSCDILFRRILRYDAIVFTLSKSYRHLRLLPGTQLAWSKGWLFWWWIGCASYAFLCF